MIVTSAFASVVPVTTVPRVGFTCGFPGAAESVKNSSGRDTLPASSVAVATSFVPSATAGLSVQVNVPPASSLAGTGAAHSFVPSGVEIVTVDPASAVPVTVVPFDGFTMGFSGAVASTTFVAGSESVPNGFVTITVMVSPSPGTGCGAHAQVRSAPIVVSHRLPESSLTTTVSPASPPVPVTRSPLVGLTTGVSGAWACTSTWVGWDSLPTASVAVTSTSAPSATLCCGVQMNSPVTAAASARHSSVP